MDKKRMRVSGGELAYIEEGDPDDPAVVFLHGFPTSSFLWRDFVPMLAPWFRVLAPDLLGCGDSEKRDGAELHIRAQAGYVRELLARLGIEDFATVGHGHGGGIAQLLALEGGVKAMVLMDSIAFDAWPGEGTRGLQQLAPEGEQESLVRRAFASFFEDAVGHPSRLTEEARQEYVRPFIGEDGVRAFFRAVRAADGVGLAGREGELERLECPVLILWGEDDPLVPVEVAQRLNDAMPTSTLGLLPGCSYLLPEDAPEVVGPLLYEYLRSRYLGAGHSHDERSGVVSLQLGRRTPNGEPAGP